MKLSREVRRLLRTNPEDVAQLNKRLLEERYPPKDARVKLERSKIGYLEIRKPPVLGRVNLSGISVTHWIFSGANNGKPAEPASADDYIDILNGLTPFDRSAWLDVEKALRNQSQFGDANKVYREMRKRIKNDADPGPLLYVAHKPVELISSKIPDWLLRFWKKIKDLVVEFYKSLLRPSLWHIWDRVQYISIGYGTKVWIPMIPALALLILSVFIFSDPQHVRASPSLVQVLQQQAEEENSQKNANINQQNNQNTNATSQKRVVDLQESPDKIREVNPEVKWTWWDALSLSLRYHVPILTSLTHSWWEASSKPLLWGFTAEHYAFFVETYHWIAWPIFLLGAAAQIARGRQN